MSPEVGLTGAMAELVEASTCKPTPMSTPCSPTDTDDTSLPPTAAVVRAS